MTPPPTDLPFDQALTIIHAVAAAHRLDSETLALSRNHGRVLAQDVMPPGDTAASADNPGPAIHRGASMTPTRVALAASLGIPAVSVARRPTVAVFTIGDDLVEPGMPLAFGQRYDSNRELIMGLLRAEGLEPTAWPRLADDHRQIEIALRDAGCAFDLIVVCESEASSESHLVADVAAGFGEIHFHGMRMESVPALFGSLDQARVLCLPNDLTAILASWPLGSALVDGLQGRSEHVDVNLL